jgi:hypothetical protein
MTVEWRDVPSCAGFRACSDGRISGRFGREVAGQADKDGYLRSIMIDAGRRRAVSHHAMVAEAFLGPKPLGAEVDHIDGQRSNNAASNLRYLTHGENMARLGPSRNSTATITAEAAAEIRRVYVPGCPEFGGAALARRYGIGRPAISKIINGVTWSNGEAGAQPNQKVTP